MPGRTDSWCQHHAPGALLLPAHWPCSQRTSPAFFHGPSNSCLHDLTSRRRRVPAPQLIKLWRTKSAADLSYAYLILYTIGLLFITVYLYLEKATVGWICESIETGESKTLLR